MLRCAICPIALAGALAAQAQPGKELIAARSALRASGSPVFLADLAKPLPPPAQNAALTYGKLIANNAAHPEPKSVQDALDKELAKSSALTPREWDNVRAALADESVRLSLIHQAVTLPYGVFEHNLKDPHPENMLLPEFVTLRAAARLVTEQSLLMAHDGKAIAAVENERLGFQIAAQSDSPPKLIISYLAANSIEGIALAGLRQILTLSHGDGVAAAAATQSIPPNLMGNHEMWNRIMDANGMYLLRAMRRAIGAADQPYAIATPVLRQINADAETNAKPSEHLMAVILMPNFESLPHTGATRENSARVTLAGAAVLQYRAKQGKFPERLESLPALVNANAFDGQPLPYTPTSSGFHISAPQPTKPGDKPKGVTFGFP